MENEKKAIVPACSSAADASDSFTFVQQDKKIHDQKFETKPVGYFKDAMIRFGKNKGSLVAAIILGLLMLFAIIYPLTSRYSVSFGDATYQYMQPKSSISTALHWEFWDGGENRSLNQAYYDYTANIPGAFIHDDVEGTKNASGKTYHDVRVDTYHAVGYKYKTIENDEYDKIVAYQEETGNQILYPLVNSADYADEYNTKYNTDGVIIYSSDANYDYLVQTTGSTKGAAQRDANGDYVHIYLVDASGNYIYKKAASDTSVRVRILYWNYFVYQNGFEPSFFFGSDYLGRDICVRLASGARLSLLLGFGVSLINLIIGVVYGAIEGYYGGVADLVMERIVEILNEVPFIITAVLFNIYLAKKVGAVGSLIFAFVLTGWIGVAGTVRMQFYRYKNSEYVLAARTLGASDSRLIFRHILPNAIGTIVTSTVLMVPSVIFSESSLSYLGIINLETGYQTSVGTMLSQGQSVLMSYPHVILFPAIFISLLMITFNMMGNGLRDALNPQLRGGDE